MSRLGSRDDKTRIVYLDNLLIHVAKKYKNVEITNIETVHQVQVMWNGFMFHLYFDELLGNSYRKNKMCNA